MTITDIRGISAKKYLYVCVLVFVLEILGSLTVPK
jgi:hypothetical protein